MEHELWPESYALWQRSRRSLVGGVSTSMRAAAKPHPLFFSRANGPYLWDVDGHRLIDYVLGWGSIILGHCPPAVVTAVTEQVSRGEMFGAQHRLEFEVAEMILDQFPFADRLLYSNTGSEAVQVALRLARAATGRLKIVKFIGHYHGWPDSVLVSYRPPRNTRSAWLESRGQVTSVLEDVLVCPWNDRTALTTIFEQFSGEIAAVIAEPVMCNSGVIAPAPGYLEWLRHLTTENGSVLIFDEVITGFRLGLSGASGHFGVSPDLVVLGKAVANGYPLGVVAGSSSILDLADQGGVMHAGTFNGNPIVLQAARATLTELISSEALHHLTQQSIILADGLRRLLTSNHVRGQVHQMGGVIQILLGVEGLVSHYDDYLQVDSERYNAVLVSALAGDTYLLPGGRIYLSAAHTTENIAQTLDVFDASLQAFAAVEFGGIG
ncbi:MAG: aspartate aminotransferase family protein [Firmicutes bacterium]|nr:aspartate aminotransferase family protein [Bacillota bacterium]